MRLKVSLIRHSFNSRPRVAGDSKQPGTWANRNVSIHARAWRATHPVRGRLRRHQVSIHARAWRATLGQQGGAQLRPVSIHARAWRATRPRGTATCTPTFQFTPARGGRPRRDCVGTSPVGFNSRPRVAGDQSYERRKIMHARFNSRPRVAGDVPKRKKIKIRYSFNSRPRVAGDQKFNVGDEITWSFNSRPRVAGDPCCRRHWR